MANFGEMTVIVKTDKVLEALSGLVPKIDRLIELLELQTRDAEQCVHLPIGGGQVDEQENDENDRPKASCSEYSHNTKRNVTGYRFCPDCGERLSS